VMWYVAVLGGKGGVGKTTISISLSSGLVRLGHKVLIVDADITGSNVQTVLGGSIAELRGEQFIPTEVSKGLYAIGMQYLDTSPLFWSGKKLGSAVLQLVELTKKDEIDFVIIDCPPGAGNEVQSILKKVKIDGAVLVTIGSKMAEDNVKNCMEMLRETQVPIIGEIKNMTYLKCMCGMKHQIWDYDFNLGIPLIARIPIDTFARGIYVMDDDDIKSFLNKLKHARPLKKRSGKFKRKLTKAALKLISKV